MLMYQELHKKMALRRQLAKKMKLMLIDLLSSEWLEKTNE